MKLDNLHQVRLSNLSIRILHRLLEEEGLGSAQALEVARLSPHMLEDPDGMVTGEQELAFQRCFAGATRGRPDLWVRAGMHYRLMSHGVVGLISLTAPNLRAFAIASRKSNYLHYSLACVEPIDGDLNGLQLDLTEVPESMREFTLFKDMAAALVAWRDMWSEPQPLTRICLTSAHPGRDWFEELLGVKVTYGADHNAWYWDKALEERPQHGNQELHEHFLRQAELTVESIQGGNGLVERLSATMRDNERLTLGMAAKQIGLSERSLQRQLAHVGLTFNELQGMVKAQIAKQLLISSPLSISQIAWQLGYADGSSFTHAFQRWTGRSPSAFRRAID